MTYREAAAAWPGVELDEDAFDQELHGRQDDRVCADELYIALACARGDSRAIAAFERRYFKAVAPALAQLSLSDDDIAEVEQLLRQRLFLGADGAPPRIVAYAGRGSLEGLVRIAAVRAGLSLLRRRKSRASDDWLEGVHADTDDPRLKALKSQQRAQFKAAFEDAVGDLDKRDRNLLKMHFLERLSIDDVGAVYAVHRATAARWVARAREELARGVRRRLVTRWRLGSDELGGVASLIESQLTLSLDRLLASAA